MHIFISHANVNSVLAKTLASAFEAVSNDVTTFVSSRAGDIRADEDWLKGVERAIQEADAYVILLTPESVLRPWVNFESGAAWFSKRKLIFLRIRALPAEEIPLPISSRQVYMLDDAEQLNAIFKALGLPLSDVGGWVAKLAEAAESIDVGAQEPAWEGIQLPDGFFAWTGPLMDLEDRKPVGPPAGLIEEIQRRGLSPRWASLNRMTHHLERGLSQVFATDRNTWRRPVMDRGRPLMVGIPRTKQPGRLD